MASSSSMAEPADKLTVVEYLDLEETLRPMEFVYGVVVREPAMPSWSHQLVSARLTALLEMHVEALHLGWVTSPVDVVLDAEAGLVVQPDIAFVSHKRQGIVRERVWGCPRSGRRNSVAAYGPARSHGQARMVSAIWR
jgi:Uma2 family endonuclease